MTVDELDFEPHPAGLGGTRATYMFDNGFGVSVITGSVFRTSNDNPYEIAVLDKDGITYDTHITDDTVGYLSKTEADKVISDVEALNA